MFDSYDDLKAAIIAWADNEDVTARVDTLLALCHVRLNRAVKLEDASVFAYTSTEVANPWVTKPPGYNGMRRFKLNDGRPPPGLVYQPFSRIDDVAAANQQGRPQWYSVAGDRIRLAPIPDAVYEVETIYYQMQPTLSPTVPTNAFLTSASDLLLYGSLIEAESYLKDHEMLQTWKDLYAVGVGDLTSDEQAQRFPDGDLAMKAV